MDVVKKFEEHTASRPSIQSNMSVVGFGFSGSGANAAMAFTMLNDWDKRDGATAKGEVALAQQAMAGTTEGTFMSLMPPAIDELGNSSGFALRLQDRANQGYAALKAAEAKLLSRSARSQFSKARPQKCSF